MSAVLLTEIVFCLLLFEKAIWESHCTVDISPLCRIIRWSLLSTIFSLTSGKIFVESLLSILDKRRYFDILKLKFFKYLIRCKVQVLYFEVLSVLTQSIQEHESNLYFVWLMSRTDRENFYQSTTENPWRNFGGDF